MLLVSAVVLPLRPRPLDRALPQRMPHVKRRTRCAWRLRWGGLPPLLWVRPVCVVLQEWATVSTLLLLSRQLLRPAALRVLPARLGSALLVLLARPCLALQVLQARLPLNVAVLLTAVSWQSRLRDPVPGARERK